MLLSSGLSLDFGLDVCDLVLVFSPVLIQLLVIFTFFIVSK